MPSKLVRYSNNTESNWSVPSDLEVEMFNTLSLKEVPVEVDLAIEALGFVPNYSKYANGTDLGDSIDVLEGHIVMGRVVDKEYHVFAISKQQV